ncbi:MAG: CaiB/BaiF CoA transferase family protein [Hyphomicrobiaceae bacterium]
MMDLASVQPLLRSLKVLELGHYIAAPFATRLMADLGADVIKIEPPGRGDPVRTWGMQVEGKSLWWSIHGRNKRSVTINMKHPDARALVLELAAQVDVVIENYRPGQLEKWGLGPKDFESAKPGLVLVRISGYGQTGPEASRSGFGVIGEAKGGLRHLCGYPSDVTDLPPVRVGIAIGDSISGFYGAIGALAAVIEQRASGAQDLKLIDVALGESVMTLLEGQLPEFGKYGIVRQPTGSWVASAAPSNAYKSKDGAWVLVAGNSDPLFKSLTEIMGKPEMSGDERFADNQARCENVIELDRTIGAWIAGQTADEALEKLDAVNIPSSKIFTIEDIAGDTQYRARRMVTEVEDPHFGAVLHPGVVPAVAGQDRDAQIRWVGPEVGEHTDQVLGELLGLDGDAIAARRGSGLV